MGAYSGECRNAVQSAMNSSHMYTYSILYFKARVVFLPIHTDPHNTGAQVKVGGVGLTSKNSTSLQRAPGPPSLSVKGESTNYPFWPGWSMYMYVAGLARLKYVHVTLLVWPGWSLCVAGLARLEHVLYMYIAVLARLEHVHSWSGQVGACTYSCSGQVGACIYMYVTVLAMLELVRSCSGQVGACT